MSSNPKALHKCFCIFWIFTREILNEILQDFDESEWTKKESLIYDSKESKFEPYNHETPINSTFNQEEKWEKPY